MSKANDNALPYADAATIVRAHQKDSYFESSFQNQIQEALHVLKGQRFINTYGSEIAVGAKAIYLALTTLIGARTLGEEYVDLMYVNRSGRRLPKLLPRLGFLISYAFVPYILSRIVRRWRLRQEDDDKRGWIHYLSSYNNVLDTLMNLHVALFYFQGQFYSVSKRIFGLRYVFGHNKDPKKLQKTGNYTMLGAIIFIQFAFSSLIKLKTLQKKPEQEEEKEDDANHVYKVKQLEVKGTAQVDLSDPSQLPYIPETSRLCMLCLSPMTDPSAANCGHMFCWECIVDWVRERPECPLCRQQCLEQNLLPLR